MEDLEDILHDSLELLGEQTQDDQGSLSYGPLTLTVAPKEGKANTLLADHLFSPALLLAEQIERGMINPRARRVVELGAGCALPSLLMATLEEPPSIVLVTDYPDDIILGNLKNNVTKNYSRFTSGCTVRSLGYEWGTDVDALLKFVPGEPDAGHFPGYDIVIMSDLLHFDTSHKELVKSVTLLLCRSDNSRVFVAAGKYTSPKICDGFLHMAYEAGIVLEEGVADDDANVWRGILPVVGLDRSQLGLRKGNCRWWVGRWAPERLKGIVDITR